MGAQFERAHQQRSAEGVVHHQGRPRFARDLRDAVDLSHAQQRIGNGLNQDAARLGLRHRGTQCVQVAHIRKTNVDAGGLQYVHQQIHAGAIKRVRRHHRFPPIGQRRNQSHVDRRHARAAGQGSVPTLERRYHFFQRRRGGIGVACVAVPGLLLRENPIQLGHRLVKITGGGMNRSGDGDVRPRLFAVSQMNGFGLNVHISAFSLPPHPALGILQNDPLLQ